MILPDFYVPWPARQNPHLATARVHAKAWAYSVGILAPKSDSFFVWEEKKYDQHDYASFCAKIHPDASLPELELMTDWNVWAFYVDDYFMKAFSGQDQREAAKEYLLGILDFMPLDLVFTRPSQSPTQTALKDLWQRTAPTQNLDWRQRIFSDTKRLLDAFLWEFDNKNSGRIANPAEYIAMRRQVGAALWSADLVEHALSVVLPERIFLSRPIQTLRACFADAVHLRNDIFSYHREVQIQGELTNSVLAMEKFLKVDSQTAMN
ncbi:MAG: germacradienol/geosmin synthase, partial [Spirochaetales bacterium]|nr:germacradienol/geosmin synthase [Spirochaetales bacterium]